MLRFKSVKSCRKIADFGRNVISAAEYRLFRCGKKESQKAEKNHRQDGCFLTTGFTKIIALGAIPVIGIKVFFNLRKSYP